MLYIDGFKGKSKKTKYRETEKKKERKKISGTLDRGEESG
jgi:hypothetical protein